MSVTVTRMLITRSSDIAISSAISHVWINRRHFEALRRTMRYRQRNSRTTDGVDHKVEDLDRAATVDSLLGNEGRGREPHPAPDEDGT
jgi:CRISPR/Cas system-associated endonuclease Cas1